tara:strand:+ start:403 stop:639 length:237 start_codon:yes stop_codon:yes gene_type:complete
LEPSPALVGLHQEWFPTIHISRNTFQYRGFFSPLKSKLILCGDKISLIVEFYSRPHGMRKEKALAGYVKIREWKLEGC